MAALLRDLGAELDAPVGCVLEGGYDVDVLARCVALTMETLASPASGLAVPDAGTGVPAVDPLASAALDATPAALAGVKLAAMNERSYGRAADEMRPIQIEPGFVRTASGSALISVGETRVICTASVQESVPRWMMGRGRGWVTAEYGMLPASTGERKQRDISKGKADGRSVEIQRLIGRSLRGVVDFEALGERTVYIDCDVLQADGGTRCASITGGMVALELATAKLSVTGCSSAHRSPALSPRCHQVLSAGLRCSISTTARTRAQRSTRTSS